MMWPQEAIRKTTPDVGIDALSPDLVSSDRLNRLFQLWKKLRGGRELPYRDAFSPEQLGFILGQVTIIDVLHNPLNFRYRLIGTRIEEAGRRGDQGKTLDQVEPRSYRDLVGLAYREVVGSARPSCHQISYVHRQDLVSFERIILPFTQTGSTVDLLLEALDWLPGVQQDLKNIAVSQAPALALHQS
jgi:hypothetical protein